MTIRENLIIRVRTSAGLILSGILFLFAPREFQIAILDLVATKFRNFKGASER